MNAAAGFPRMEAGVPLGGIGAGKIEFCADGRITNVTTNNNLDCPITDGFARTPLFPRIKEGAEGSVLENALRRQSINSAEGLPGAWAAVHTPQLGARLLKCVGRPAFAPIRLDQIRFAGRFPVVHFKYDGLGSLGLSLEAYSPFDLTDPSPDCSGSALPLALFAFTATNHGATDLPVTLAFSWQNLNGIGGYPMTPINDPDATPPVFRDDPSGPGVWFDHDPASRCDRRVLGNYALRVDPDAGEITSCVGWATEREGREVWDPFAAAGQFDNSAHASRGGALAARFVLAPGGARTVTFALAWFMPDLLAAETRWDHLVRPSSAPPPPTTPDRRNEGHRYAMWFDDAWAVAGHGLQHAQDIRARIAGWQDALASLPPRAVDGLCNDLCALVSNTWYTRDGHYAVNEAPTDMNGCFGTLDQRSVGNAAVAMAFSALNRAELALFAADQIGADDARRHAPHWNSQGGHFDRPLDREGAILHDIGFDHLHGGRTGDVVWSSAHWPELTSHFVLQCYQHALWTGDREWLDARYGQFKAALHFQMRLDQDADGVPDLWGSGSNTYDTELYPYYGAAAYTSGLLLAALRVCEILATERGDSAFASWSRERFEIVRQVIEDELWDEAAGHYHCWRDHGHASWGGARAHGPRSTACHISQLAGGLWGDLLGLGDLFDPARRRRALATIGRRNVEAVAGCPADESRADGQVMQSMAALAMGNFAAQAIAAGLPDAGWLALERIYHARYDHDGCPWDAPLQWSGPDNLQPQWGRWYMSHPASWYVLWALGGVRPDRLRGRLAISPSWPSAWGGRLRDLPVFLPGLHGRIDAERGDGVWKVGLRVVEAASPLHFSTVELAVPPALVGGSAEITVAGAVHRSVIGQDGRVLFGGGFTAAPGTSLQLLASGR